MTHYTSSVSTLTVAVRIGRHARKRALVERKYRRLGLALSLVAIAVVLVGLWFYVKQIER